MSMQSFADKLKNAVKAAAEQDHVKWFTYAKGADFELCFVDGEKLRELASAASTSTYKRGKETTDLDERKFRRASVRQYCRSWKLTLNGFLSIVIAETEILKATVAEQLGVEVSEVTGESEIAFDYDILEMLCTSSVEFESWIWQTSTDPGMFVKPVQEDEQANLKSAR